MGPRWAREDAEGRFELCLVASGVVGLLGAVSALDSEWVGGVGDLVVFGLRTESFLVAGDLLTVARGGRRLRVGVVLNADESFCDEVLCEFVLGAGSCRRSVVSISLGRRRYDDRNPLMGALFFFAACGVGVASRSVSLAITADGVDDLLSFILLVTNPAISPKSSLAVFLCCILSSSSALFNHQCQTKRCSATTRARQSIHSKPKLSIVF